MLTKTIQVNNPNTAVLGLGLPTLLSDNGQPLIKTADADGITLSGPMLEAGAVESGVLVEVGSHGSTANHASNPIALHGLFSRICLAQAGRVGIALSLNSNNTIVDHTWFRRADHGNGVGWTTNLSANGLWVNGNDVTFMHCSPTTSSSNRSCGTAKGRLYFYQSELPYDPPSQSAWNSLTGNGYASYEVADGMTSHEAWGLGVYSLHQRPNLRRSSH